MSDDVKRPWTRVGALVTALLTATASIAAAVSVGLTWQGFTESRQAELVAERIRSCEEISEHASNLILQSLTQTQARLSVSVYGQDLYTPEDADYGHWVVYDPVACPQTDATCASRQAENLETLAELGQRKATIRFESDRRFIFIGPRAMVEAEERLARALQARRGNIEFDTRAAEEALVQFRMQCATMLGGYRASVVN